VLFSEPNLDERRTLTLSPTKGADKHKKAIFRVKLNFAWRKSVAKFFCVKTNSDKVVRHSLAYLCAKMVGGRGRHLKGKFCRIA